jgi:hypothetical protein
MPNVYERNPGDPRPIDSFISVLKNIEQLDRISPCQPAKKVRKNFSGSSVRGSQTIKNAEALRVHMIKEVQFTWRNVLLPKCQN